ncbi:MAG: twin-arginine translocase TatA/TatE family subunit [Gemmobacter sp.]
MLNNIGLPGLILIVVVVLVLFGRGKIAGLMGEIGKGITAFKRGVKDETAEIEKAAAEARDVSPAGAAADKDKA